MRIFFLLTFLIPLFGCRREEMRTERVPKEVSIHTPASSMEDSHEGHSHGSDLPEGHPPVGEGLPEGHPPVAGTLPEGHPDVGNNMGPMDATAVNPGAEAPRAVTWTTPKGWQEKPGSGFRYATFVVPGTGGAKGDMSITILEGEAGGLMSNVNRWRGQIGLAPWTESDLNKFSRSIFPAGRKMTLVNFVSETPIIDGKFKQRLLAAVYWGGGKTWFFKLVGEDRLVQSAQTSFLSLLESLEGL